MTRVAILNSHQSKTPVGDDPWVAKTVAAVEFALHQHWRVLSSVDLNTWELVTRLTARGDGLLELVVPASHSGEAIERSILMGFGLNPDRVQWHFVDQDSVRRFPKSWWTLRDDRICELADVLLPVSIRPGGRMEAQLSQTASARTIDERFRVPHGAQPHHDDFSVDPDRLHPALRTRSNDYLIHWTRACHGPWPGEHSAAFYDDLVASGDAYCRSAQSTLQRILREKTVRASAWRIGAQRPMVAFTELSPIESLPLMRWRSRWSRWSFEPYGIAFRRDWATIQGVRPVRYVTEEEWRSLPADEKPLCHRRGRLADLWPAEREWRHAGDLVFADAPLDAVRVIVRSPADAATVRHLIDAPVDAFTC